MKVLKFGGSSVAAADRILTVSEIVRVRATRPGVVVLSAMQGTTDELIAPAVLQRWAMTDSSPAFAISATGT
jgi:aspartokinase